MIGVPLVVAADWGRKKNERRGRRRKEEGRKKRKRCVRIHTISSRCKKRPEAFARCGTSAAAATPTKNRKKHLYLSPGGIRAQERKAVL